ncbi:MAG: Hsp20/alpha crystallin family protein [Bacteroidetes bacterium]|nr:hypothetical protein AWN76_014155 [Rhodothermaceae bacterium RA]RMH60072.1 MAG: Hsp20/alpha crystallin family protein [Bacteroidota bacterium]
MANLTQYTYRPLAELQREVDRLFNTFFAPTGTTTSAVWAPAVDIGETDDAYVFAFDLPGLSKKDVEILYEDGYLIVSGERRPVPKQELRFHRMERPWGRFYRSIRLDRPVEVDDIRARFENGVLMVHVPKTEESKPQRIKIS